jgi:hypothetical protein
MENGHVSIAWRYQDQQGEPKFVFIWRTLGGTHAAELPLWALARVSFPGYYQTISEASLKCRMNQQASFDVSRLHSKIWQLPKLSVGDLQLERRYRQ